MAYNRSNPVALSSTVLLTSTSGSLSFDAGLLTNLDRNPVEIREMIVTAVGQSTGGAPRASALGLVKLKGKFNRHSMTASGHVSMAVLGPARSWEAENIGNLPQMASYLSNRGFAAQVRWQFHRPLIVAPGGGFVFEAQMSADDIALLASAPDNIRVTLAFIGRDLAAGVEMPKAQLVPYASDCRINVNNVAGSGGDKLFLSQANELTNPNASPFTVRRIVGQRFYINTTAPSAFLMVNASAETSNYATASDLTKELFNLQFPDRTKLCADRIPFHMVFGQRSFVEGEFIVPPTARCVAELFSFQRNYAAKTKNNEVVKLGIVGDRPEVV